ncbi:MAG: polymer-forming cytoskeletal protein [Candidatus Acidiferrum sp.]
MWDKRRPNEPEGVAPEPKELLKRRQNLDAVRPSDATADRPTAWLGSSVHIKGDISGTEDLLIDGSVEGLIQLDERRLTVGPTAKLTADINAKDVVVHGYVKGNVHATGRIEIKKDGSVIGNLTTAEVRIEDGADFKGSLEIVRGDAKEADKNVYPRTASASAGAGG